MRTHYHIKPHNDVPVAHVYEHLYIVALRQALFERGLFVHLDFAVDGTTYPSFVQIAITIYTSRAQQVFDDLMPFDAPVNNYTIREAAYEILVEHRADIEGAVPKIKKAIVALHASPWSCLKDLDFVKLETKKQPSLAHYTDKKVPLQRLVCRAILYDADDNGQTAPLFYVIATAIHTNLLLVLNGRYHYYCQRVGSRFNGHTMQVDDIYDGWTSYRPKLSTEAQACREVLDTLVARDITSSIVAYLRGVDYGWRPGPKYDEIARATGVIVGSKGWRKRADKNKIDSILRNMIIELRYGTQVETLWVIKPGSILSSSAASPKTTK